MALQASGAISLADIQTEFGGDNPISLSEYNNGGAYVGSWVSGVPSSGARSLSNFYGKSKYITPVSGTEYFKTVNPTTTLTSSNGASGTLVVGIGNTDTDNGQSSVNTYSKVIAAGTRVCEIINNNLSGTFRVTIKAFNNTGSSTNDGFIAIGHFRTGGYFMNSGQYFGWSPSYAGANQSVTAGWNFNIIPGDELRFTVASASGGSVNRYNNNITTFMEATVVGP